MKLGPVAFVGNVVSGAFAAGGAAIGSQFPEFVQQYLQRLGGHRDEAWRFLENLIRAGMAHDNPVRAAAEQRFLELDKSLADITINQGFARLVAFVETVDWDIARAASHVFRPAVPLTPEGFAFAGIGLLSGVLAFHLCAGTCKSAWSLGKLAFKRKAAIYK
ncbi:MAG: DUF2937 family protein [Alphaproteobacteria bacterium]|nr:DUF2937 family protein [Alphaproteobacteria bacterium]